MKARLESVRSIVEEQRAAYYRELDKANPRFGHEGKVFLEGEHARMVFMLLVMQLELAHELIEVVKYQQDIIFGEATWVKSGRATRN